MKISGLWKSFRVRIVVLISLGLWILVSIWMIGVYRLVLHSRLNEVDAQLKVAAYQFRPRLLFRIPGLAPDMSSYDPEVVQRLLLIQDQDGQQVQERSDLSEADLAILAKVLDGIPVNSMEPPGNGPGEPPGKGPGDPHDMWGGPDNQPVPPFLVPQRQPPMPEMEMDKTNLPPVTLDLSIGQWRCQPFTTFHSKVLLGEPLEPVYRQSRTVLKLMALLNPALLVLTLVITWLVVSRALLPIRQMTVLASRIDADRLDARLSADLVPSEFQKLLEVFNSMLERLERSFYQARRFSADAAHELKTPLTILQGQLEQEIAQETVGSARQQTLSSLLDEVARLKRITEGLLLLAYGDSGRLRMNREMLNLRKEVEQVVSDYEDEEIRWEILPAQAEPVPFSGDPVLLAKALQNLASNAMKYNRPNGLVRIELGTKNGRIHLLIGNTGDGIPPSVQPLIFDRFVRADATRNRAVDGTGLGLSIVQEVVRIHGGTVNLVRSDDDWTEFLVTLPAVGST